MFEDLAWRYLLLPEAQIWLIKIGLIVLGGIAAALFHRGAAVFDRVAYFTFTAIVTIASSLGQAVWLLSGQAMLGGWVSVLAGADAIMGLAAGYVFVAIGQARSRDVLGHARAGILSIVPVANLWLLFKPGQDPLRADPVAAPFRGGVGILVGLVLMLTASATGRQLGRMAEEGAKAVTEDPAHAVVMLDARLRISPLSEVLREVSANTFVPLDVGGGVTMIAVEANGSVLRYVYAVNAPRPSVDQGMADLVRTGVCADPMLGRLMAEGARVVVRHQWLGGTDSSHSVAHSDCAV